MGIDADAQRAGRPRKQKKPLEAVQGRYCALPHSVLDSEAWRGCSPAARALLLELCRQHSGSNNGHLHLARSWLEPRGWKSPPVVNRLRDELMRLRLLAQTRHGGLRNGPHLFAVTWLPVSDWRGLHMTAHDFRPGAYLLEPLPEPPKKQNGCNPFVRGAAPARNPSVQGQPAPRNPSVRVEAPFADSPRNPSVHNECLPLRTGQTSRHIIAGKGRAAQTVALAGAFVRTLGASTLLASGPNRSKLGRRKGTRHAVHWRPAS